MKAVEKIVECLRKYKKGVRVIKYEFDVRMCLSESPTVDTKFVNKTRVIIPNENRRKENASGNTSVIVPKISKRNKG